MKPKIVDRKSEEAQIGQFCGSWEWITHGAHVHISNIWVCEQWTHIHVRANTHTHTQINESESKCRASFWWHKINGMSRAEQGRVHANAYSHTHTHTLSKIVCVLYMQGTRNQDTSKIQKERKAAHSQPTTKPIPKTMVTIFMIIRVNGRRLYG